MSGSKRLHIERRGDYLWVVLPDSITADSSAIVESKIVAGMSRGGERLVLDLSRTIHIYSSGIGVIVGLRRRVGESGGALCLVNVSRRCRELLESVQLHKVIPIYATDVEFEIEHDLAREDACAAGFRKFGMFVGIEGALCRIILSGRIAEDQDLSDLQSLTWREGVRGYLFDLAGVDFLDSRGAELLTRAVMGIQARDGVCAAFGADAGVTELAQLLSIDHLMPFYPGELSAVDALSKVM